MVPSFLHYSERKRLLYLGLDSAYRLDKCMFTHMHMYSTTYIHI